MVCGCFRPHRSEITSPGATAFVHERARATLWVVKLSDSHETGNRRFGSLLTQRGGLTKAKPSQFKVSKALPFGEGGFKTAVGWLEDG